MARNLSPLETAYQYCEKLARTHYENFPVASLLLPSNLRRSIAVIYAFARQADDIADEGDFTPAVRLQQLQHYWQSLDALNQGISLEEPIFLALADVLKKHPQLPIMLLFDLLSAFKQDVIKKEYANFDEILNYCQYSANPIGRLLLYLTHHATEENLKDSDAICTALQLINFLQDLQSDLLIRNRCYLPKDELLKYHISLEMLTAASQTKTIEDLMILQLNQAQVLLESGATLGKRLPGLFGFEIRLIISAGRQMINLLRHRNSLYIRPTLHLWHWPKILWNAL